MGATMTMEAEGWAMPGDEDDRGEAEAAPPPDEAAEEEPRRIGAFLREDRKRSGLRQVDVARKIGFNQTKLSAYELDKIMYPPPERLVALARIYGRPDNYYLDIVGWPSAAVQVRTIERYRNVLNAMDASLVLRELVFLAVSMPDDALAALVADIRAEQRWRDQRQDNRGQEPTTPSATATRDSA